MVVVTVYGCKEQPHNLHSDGIQIDALGACMQPTTTRRRSQRRYKGHTPVKHIPRGYMVINTSISVYFDVIALSEPRVNQVTLSGSPPCADAFVLLLTRSYATTLNANAYHERRSSGYCYHWCVLHGVQCWLCHMYVCIWPHRWWNRTSRMVCMADKCSRRMFCSSRCLHGCLRSKRCGWSIKKAIGLMSSALYHPVLWWKRGHGYLIRPIGSEFDCSQLALMNNWHEYIPRIMRIQIAW